jgi:molybdate transport system ATP-binding protein
MIGAIDAPIGTPLHIRLEARNIILATHHPKGISALNILPVTVVGLIDMQGPNLMVDLRAGDAPILAHITKRSAKALGLRPDMAVFAIVKSVSIMPDDLRIHSPPAPIQRPEL